MAFLSFLGNILHGDQNPGGGVLGFLRNLQSDVGKVSTIGLNGARAVVGGVTGNRQATQNAFNQATQGINVIRNITTRPIVQLGSSIAQPLTHQSVFNPSQSGVTSAVFGNEPIPTIQGTYSQAKQAGHGVPFSFLAAGLTAASDYPIFGGIGKNVMEDLIKSATEEGAAKVLIKSGVDEATASRIAPAIAITKDPSTIQNIIQKAHEPFKAPSRAPTIPRSPTPDEILNKEVSEGYGTISDVIPPASINPMQDIHNAIIGKVGTAGQEEGRSLASLSKERSATISAQRGQRLEASKQAGLKQEGSAGYFQELHQLGGDYEKPQIGGMVENIGPGRAEELFSGARKQIQSIPDSTFATYIKENGIKGLEPRGARLNLQTAMRKIIFGEGGGIPTQGELKLIKHVNPELGIQIESRIPKQRQIFDFAAKLFGLPRALKSTLDLSMGGRQGILVAARNPIIWARANKESFKMFKSPDYYHQEMQGLRARPSYSLAERYGVRLPATHGAHEEAFASSDLAEKIPVAEHAVLASSRAYDGGLARMRMDKWDQLLSKYGGVDQAEKNLGRQGMTDLAEVVNTLTGRGGKKGGLVEKHMNSLSTTLFSPRLWASRLNTLNPQYYWRLTPAARDEALQSAGAFAVVAGAALTGLASLGAEVSTDPRSADFLKVKFGDTRYDILGGFQQNLVFAWRELSGEKVNSQTGSVTKYARSPWEVLTGQHPVIASGPGTPNRVSVSSDVVGNKLNPALSSALKLTEGKDKSGQKVNPLTEISQLFVPPNLQGAYQLIQHTNEGTFTPTNIGEGVLQNIPNIFGVGTQSYGIKDLAISNKQKAYLDLQKSNGASPEQLNAQKNFFQYLKVASGKKQNTNDSINHYLSMGDQQKAQEEANNYNQQVLEKLNPWLEQNRGQLTPELIKELKSSLIDLTPSSIKSRLTTIVQNPDKYNLKLQGATQ